MKPITDHKFQPGNPTTSSPSADRSCIFQGCGKIEAAHGQAAPEKQELPAWMEAEEYLEKVGAKGTQFYELARNLLAGYIEWRRKYAR